MGQRAYSVLRALAGLRRSLGHEARPDAILARNLEMLVLARRTRRLWPGDPPGLIYEVLDIHRLMVGEGRRAQAMRAVERALLRGVGAVLTSSPAFISNYFDRYRQTQVPVHLVENRYFEPRATAPNAVGPVRTPDEGTDRAVSIGWFGILRCRDSLACLDALTRARPGRYVVEMRGKPALDVLPRFHEIVAANPDLRFHGPYRYPDDLPDMYTQVDLAWLLDGFDAGYNSAWLLPNRLYEGCRHGAVPIAQAGTQTATFIQALGLGLVVSGPSADELDLALGQLTPGHLARLRELVHAVDPATWTASDLDCRHLVSLVESPIRGLG